MIFTNNRFTFRNMPNDNFPELYLWAENDYTTMLTHWACGLWGQSPARLGPGAKNLGTVLPLFWKDHIHDKIVCIGHKFLNDFLVGQ